MKIKSVTNLSIQDLESTSIWQYINDDSNELALKPLKTIPVKNLTGKIVATQVKLVNGSLFWGLIGNIDTTNQKLTEHFLTFSIYNNGKWFSLARYHDSNYDTNGPKALSNFLDLPKDSIFPIHYDILNTVIEHPAFLEGLIQKEPLNN